MTLVSSNLRLLPSLHTESPLPQPSCLHLDSFAGSRLLLAKSAVKALLVALVLAFGEQFAAPAISDGLTGGQMN